MNKLSNIENKIYDLSEKDINEWVAKDLVEHFSNKLNYFASDIYGSSSLARRAFKEQALIKVKKACHTFILDKKHWRNGRSLEPYIRKVIKNLYHSEKYCDNFLKKVYLCPGCSFYDQKEICVDDGKELNCSVCLSNVSDINKSKIAAIFAFHSRAGFECPDCKRFIPTSFVKSLSVNCPYIDCIWFGTKSSLKEKAHPQTTITRSFIRGNEINGDAFSVYKDNNPSALLKLEIKNQTEIEYGVLQEVIKIQSERLLSKPIEKNIKKRLMYKAFSNMVEKDPEGMIRYLVHQKVGGGDIPIQSQIFQEFIKLVENSLPFEIIKYGQNVEILSLLDNKLDLFLGKSVFDGIVNENGIVFNETKESYIGGRELRDFGPCFIGYLCDVTGPNGSLLNNVEYYTFAQIKLKNVEPGTKVVVKHFRIPSHYELSGMVILQRQRKKIVSAVSRKLERYEKNK